MEAELWSIKEKRAYPERNASRTTIGGVIILTTPGGEPLVTRVI